MPATNSPTPSGAEAGRKNPAPTTSANPAAPRDGNAAVPEHPKVSKRRINRIVAMQMLYAWGCSPCAPEKTAEFVFDFLEQQPRPREFYAFAEELFAGTLQNLARIDGIISDCAKNWSLARIARCDLAILRLAIYEMLYRNDIPPIVSINEAIDLAKQFSTEDSHRFVNGVLDRIKAQLSRPLRDAQR